MKHPKFKNQKEMFMYIWNSRPHISELSGDPLLPIGHWQWHWQFIHVLPKGTYSDMKLDPDNVMLGLPYEHIKQEDYPAFVKKRIELTSKYYAK